MYWAIEPAHMQAGMILVLLVVLVRVFCFFFTPGEEVQKTPGHSTRTSNFDRGTPLH